MYRAGEGQASRSGVPHEVREHPQSPNTGPDGSIQGASAHTIVPHSNDGLSRSHNVRGNATGLQSGWSRRVRGIVLRTRVLGRSTRDAPPHTTNFVVIAFALATASGLIQYTFES